MGFDPSDRRFRVERDLRQRVWEQDAAISGHPFWSPYSEVVASFLAPDRPPITLKNHRLTRFEQDAMKYGFSFYREPALLFSGGLDSVYAHWWHNESGLSGNELKLITLDDPISSIDRDMDVIRSARLAQYFPVTRIPAWWIGSTELGAALELIPYGYGEVYFAGEWDGSTYDEEQRWPSGPLEMPDYSQMTWAAWEKHTGQRVRATNTQVNKLDMVKTLAYRVPEMLRHVHSCMTMASEERWCGRCIKCLLMEVVYETADVESPVRFRGTFGDPTFRMAYQRRAVWDNIRFVLEPAGALKMKRSKKLHEFMRQFPHEDPRSGIDSAPARQPVS
jgi:hypothetical protein